MDQMTEDKIREIFKGLEAGDGASFFEQHVADDVQWTVMGTHPLAGQYSSKKDFFAATFARLTPILPGGVQLRVEHVIAKGDEAAVELRAMATAKNGMRFDNRYCWVLLFKGGKIVQARAYLDSALVAQLIREHPGT